MKNKILAIIQAGILAIALVSCSSGKKEAEEEVSAIPIVTEAVATNTAASVISETPTAESEIPKATSTFEVEEKETTVTLCIGMEGMMKEYKYTISGKITAEKLVAGIAETTGWNLDLAEQVTSGKDGMIVCFANTASIFTGPPEPQKDEFMVYDEEELIMTILESIKKTLQKEFVEEELGNPSSLNIYFCGEGGTELEFDDISKYVPIDEPYTELKSNDTIPTGKVRGKFMGFADSTTIEVNVKKKSVAYQVYDKQIIDVLNKLEEGTVFTFQTTDEDGISTITKILEE